MPTTYSLFLLTFNCARLPQDPTALSAALSSHFPPHAPDLLLISLQELLPIPQSFQPELHLQAYLTPLLSALPTSHYAEPPIIHSLGPTAVVIFSRVPVLAVDYAALGLGPWDVSSKGGVSVRVSLRDAVLSATAVHLSPDETRFAQRDREWGRLVAGLVFEDGSQIYPRAPREYGFVFGDLNYRTADARPAAADVRGGGGLRARWERDQLVRSMKAGTSMHGLHEATVGFPVSYKYEIREGGGTVQNRWPSWTDRILFWPGGVRTGAYGSVMEYCGSDHKMVYLNATVGEEDGQAVMPPFGPDEGWRERREAARRLEAAVGTVWLASGSYVIWAVVFAVGLGGYWAYSSVQV